MAKFKIHKMYSKSGNVQKAETMGEHLKLKKKGFNHDSRRAKTKK